MIQTVLGSVGAELIVRVLPHEHMLCDLRPLVAPLDNGIFYDKVALSNYGALSRNPYAVLDNAALDDREAAAKECRLLKKAGFDLIADATTEDFGRDPLFLRQLSLDTGVHIVAGCGSYTDVSVTEQRKRRSVDQMRQRILDDLLIGMDGTDIKAGMIGEIGSSEEMTPAEYKVLQAAAEAQSDTGFGMHIHACLWNREGLKALDHAIACGADPQKICVDHSDVLLDEGYMMGILERGAWVEFDNFGKEYYVDRWNRNLLKGSFAYDKERVVMLKKLIDRGYVNQLLVTNDICLKSMLHNYGGWGYDHIGVNVLPMMEDYGITPEQINTITRENAIDFLERG